MMMLASVISPNTVLLDELLEDDELPEDIVNSLLDETIEDMLPDDLFDEISLDDSLFDEISLLDEDMLDYFLGYN